MGQELLAAGLCNVVVTLLELALKIGFCSLKMKGSVFRALKSAHWAQLDKAIGWVLITNIFSRKNSSPIIRYRQQDLVIAKSLGDTEEECRTYGNLGSAYFSQGSYIEALTVP